MIRTLTLASVTALGLSATAMAETRTYDVSEFTGLSVSSGLDVTFSTGAAQSVLVENKNGDFDDIEVEVKNGMLKLSRKNNNWGMGWNKRERYSVTVTAVSLDRVEASSGSDVEGSGLSGAKVSLSTSSGSDLTVSDIDAVEVRLESSSGSDLNASGICEKVYADSSSGSDIEASDLVCQYGDADASSGSDIEIHATTAVTADASSGADIDVYGGPTDVDSDKSSGGRVSVKG